MIIMQKGNSSINVEKIRQKHYEALGFKAINIKTKTAPQIKKAVGAEEKTEDKK